MAIGGSNGSWFEDEFQQLAAQQPQQDIFEQDEAYRQSLVPITTHDEELKQWSEEMAKVFNEPLKPLPTK